MSGGYLHNAKAIFDKAIELKAGDSEKDDVTSSLLKVMQPCSIVLVGKVVV